MVGIHHVLSLNRLSTGGSGLINREISLLNRAQSGVVVEATLVIYAKILGAIKLHSNRRRLGTRANDQVVARNAGVKVVPGIHVRNDVNQFGFGKTGYVAHPLASRARKEVDRTV